MKKESRKVLEQIATLAASDPEAAADLAWHGRKRSEIQKVVWAYLSTMDERLNAKHPESYLKFLTESAENFASELCGLFLDALDKRDCKALSDIAVEVKSFGKSQGFYDRKRALILWMKNILDDDGDKMTVARLAGLLNRKLGSDPVVIPDTEDSHSQLRRLCRQLKFPLAEEKRGPKLKTDKRKNRSLKS